MEDIEKMVERGPSCYELMEMRGSLLRSLGWSLVWMKLQKVQLPQHSPDSDHFTLNINTSPPSSFSAHELDG